AEGTSGPGQAAEIPIDDLQNMRRVLVGNFGFLDAASLEPGVDVTLAPEDRPDPKQKAEAAWDGHFGMADLQSAARSEFLESPDSEALKQLSQNQSLFDKLDARDGEIDGEISYSALWKAAGPGEEDLPEGEFSQEVPGAHQANYNDRFFELQQQMDGIVWEHGGHAAALEGKGPDAILSADHAAANVLDAMDGKADMLVNGKELKLASSDAKENLFTSPANDGSGMTTLTAAIKSMSDEFAKEPRPELPGALNDDRPRAYRMALALWDNLPAIGKQGGNLAADRTINRDDVTAALGSDRISAPDKESLNELLNDKEAWSWLSSAGGSDNGGSISLKGMEQIVGDFNKANFSGIIMAAGAVRTGIPMKTSQFSGDSFPEDMAADFASSKIFDPAVAEAAYTRLMNDPGIQKMLAEKVREFTVNASSQAQGLFAEMSSTYYFDSLAYVEKMPNGVKLAEDKLAADMAALSTLDPKLAEQASTLLLQRKVQAALGEATPSKVPAEQVTLATRDFLTALSLDLRTARGMFRLPGLIAGHDAGWQKLSSLVTSWPADKIGQMSEALSKALIRADSASSVKGAPPSSQTMFDILDKDVTNAKAELGSAANAADRSRLQGVLEGVTKRTKDLKDLVAAAEKNGVWASLAGGISLASGVYKLVEGGENLKGNSWGRLAIANDFVLATCFTPGYLSQANYWMGRLGQSWSMSSIGMAPSQTFGSLVKAFVTGDTAAVGTGMSGATLGMVLKGITGASLLAAGTIGGAMGVKQLVDGIGRGEDTEIAAGSLNIAMGTSWTASGVSYLLGSAMTGPLIGVGCIFGVAAVLLSIFGQKPDEKFADAFAGRLGDFSDSGVLREGWRDSAKDWFNDNQNKQPQNLGVGLDL
ncbi:MAG: hypothetical protein RIR70_1092, partial [Pseudomonadota bacterium]